MIDPKPEFSASYGTGRGLGLHANPDGGIVFCMSDIYVTTEAEIWSRAIRPEIGDLSTEAAREWLRLRLSEADAERVRELSSKANAGTLTADEDRELEQYLNVGRTLEFLKAKARLSLRDAA
jgi:hypothetical protein